MRIPWFFIQSMVALFFANQLRAEVVTQSFTGVITAVNSGGQAGTPIGSPVDEISIGTPFTAMFSYQTNNSGVDLNAPNTSQGVFTITPSAETLLTINVNGRVFQKAAVGNFGVQTFNNVVSTLSNNTDSLSVFATGPTLPTAWSVANANTVSTRLTFFDSNGLALPSDALPTSFSPNWSIGLFSQTFNSNVTTPTGVINSLYLEGSLNLTAVPEPSALGYASLVLSFSAFGFLTQRYRREKSKVLG